MIESNSAPANFLAAKVATLPIIESVLAKQNEDKKLRDALEYTLGDEGKFFRASLVLASGEIFNLAHDTMAPIAAAVEMVHAYSLVHDDLPAMDNADIRRGKPSCWSKFDEATAILTGDALLTMAFEIITDEQYIADVAISSKLVNSLAKAIGANGMIAGQMIDLFDFQGLQGPIDLSIVEKLQYLKTGRLIQFCCQAGAIVGKAVPEEHQDLINYGKSLGLIFQITDDLLDALGKPEEIGKPINKTDSKLNFVHILGEFSTRKMLNELQVKATGCLHHFDYKAQALQSILDWTIQRKF